MTGNPEAISSPVGLGPKGASVCEYRVNSRAVGKPEVVTSHVANAATEGLLDLVRLINLLVRVSPLATNGREQDEMALSGTILAAVALTPEKRA